MTANTQLVDDIRRALADNANPGKAEGMRAYMKSEMPYRGVQKPARRKLVNAALRAHPFDDKTVWQSTVFELWRSAEYREERYIALDIAGAPSCRAFRTLDTLPMFEEFVVTGAWWDYVDDVATHRLRELLEHYPSDMAGQMRSWSHGEDMWKRRSSIICQINRKDQTDLDLLFDCIEPNLSHTDFFIRKGIGWALRSLAWTDLATVEDYVARNRDRLSTLSAREALKNAAKIRRSS
ncbi:MAG: DNA alkylation repair protein [Acidimicrobiales bacterium]|nr:DNA alkylation repair protein [Acidimicrobiales bacterium]MYG60199.1 DNA alkylation repair protein [Acidimicrobiales bacterium]